MAFADEYQGVEAHGNTKLHVIHTNDKKQVAITLSASSATRSSALISSTTTTLKRRRNPPSASSPSARVTRCCSSK